MGQAHPDNSDYWGDLLTRVAWIRNLYSARKISIRQGEGLAVALDEAEACCLRIKKRSRGNDDALATLFSCHTIWGLYDNLSTCLGFGLSIDHHLKRITTGSVDYGTRSRKADRKDIFFKDFEAELLVASTLIRAGVRVEFMENSSDPLGEMTVGDLVIEVKHPDGPKRHETLMRKFNSGLRRFQRFGVFVTALEDAFEIMARVRTTSDLAVWDDAKANEIEAFGLKAVARAASLLQIIVLVQTSSHLQNVGDESRFVRKSNSILFDDRRCDSATFDIAKQIAGVFNPQPLLYSQIQSLLPRKQTTAS